MKSLKDVVCTQQPSYLMETNNLIVLCKTYNVKHPELIIDLNKYLTKEELIFCLWERDVDIGDFGFGQPYDETFKNYSREYDAEDEDLERRLYGLNNNSVYQSYLHPDMVSNFLCNALDLPLVIVTNIAVVSKNLKDFRDSCPEQIDNNINKFNDFWCKLIKKPIKDYTELRQILVSNTLTNLDLCYLLWECDNYGIFREGISVWTVIEQIKKM
jgi:hypothetical protein